MDGLEKRIIEIIEYLYNCVFTAHLKVTVKDDLYTLEVFLSDPNFGGYTLAKQCKTDDEFLQFITDELASNQLTRHKFQQLIIQPYEYLQECEPLQEGI